MTGTATGPHLHFGVYNIHRAQTPVDPYGWSGSYPDPYSWDQGDLWLTGSPRYPGIALPRGRVGASTFSGDPAASPGSWSSPRGAVPSTTYGRFQGRSIKLWVRLSLRPAPFFPP